MDKQEVLNFLPHRPPFLFIDSVREVIPSELLGDDTQITDTRKLVGTEVICEFEVTDQLEILKGHFPGNPILPGVVQVEMMAQCSAFTSLGIKALDPRNTKVDTILISVANSKFRKPIYPGMKLEIHATMSKCRGNIASYECYINCEGEKVSEATFMAKLEVVK